MAATSSYDNPSSFIELLAQDYPNFKFKPGKQDHWSPSSKTIIYNPKRPLKELQQSILHELSHALLEHRDYKSDFELLKLEAAAWHKAAEIAPNYGLTISEDHIQDCLDTYRDWLHNRSACPTCGTHSLQESPKLYRCLNCQTRWSVTNDRFARAYRKSA